MRRAAATAATGGRSIVITGPASSGKTAALVSYLHGTGSGGAEIWVVGGKSADLDAALKGWPEVTRFAARPSETAELIEQAHAEMVRRYELVETGHARLSSFGLLVLAVDEYPSFMLVLREHLGGADGDQLLRRFRQVMRLGQAAGIRYAITCSASCARAERLPVGACNQINLTALRAGGQGHTAAHRAPAARDSATRRRHGQIGAKVRSAP
jgi:hypothetical protein